MWKLLFQSSPQPGTSVSFTETFKDHALPNPEAVKGGNSVFKEALAGLITEKARQVVATDYGQAPGWQCLNEPVKHWEHNQFIYLATLLDVGTCTLKRIYGHKCYEDSTENISLKVKEKLRYFLRTDNLEELMVNYILQKENNTE
jgi:hypothetical protein